MIMGYSRMTAVAALAAFAFLNCGGDQKPAETPSSEPSPSAEPPAAPADADAGATSMKASTPAPAESATAEAAPVPESLTDEQIAAITDAANTAEIAQAKLAESKSRSPDVKRFAAMMIHHHGDAKKKQAQLKLQMADSSDSTALKADATSTLEALKKDSGKVFDKAYIDAQVDGHQKVLDAINQKLLPNVKNADLKAYLDEIKPRVEEHLKQAKELQESFDSKSSAVDSAKKHAG
jgi:putative membrane protein